jgi:hypothetical protein
MPKLSLIRVVAVALISITLKSAHAGAEPIALTETSEQFCTPRIINDPCTFDGLTDDLTYSDSCDEIEDHLDLQDEPSVTPVAIAPLPPAVLTGAGMLLGGALIRLVRKIRMT